MKRLYSLLIPCVACCAFLVLLWRGFKDRAYWRGLAERWGGGARRDGSSCMWLHAVSLGEMSAAAPLVRALHARHKGLPVVLTSATPAGRMRAESLFGSFADVRYLPYDTAGATRRFIGNVKPKFAIIMETELWPNLYAACGRGGIPVLLANARLSARSVRRYRRLGSLTAGLFGGQVLIAAQSADDAARFVEIGAPLDRICVAGNIKFDIELRAATAGEGRALRTQFGTRPIWIAGSTHPGEDEVMLDAHRELLTSKPEALLILVPRHKERFDEVAALLQAGAWKFARRSDPNARPAECQVLLVDTLGELQRLYASADLAFVGGSLVPIGGHNLLEPACLALPVLSGPSNANGKDIAAALEAHGALKIVTDATQLAETLKGLFADASLRSRMGAAGQALVAANRGSVERLLKLIEPWAAGP
jgi:3-deoxy-D-manno-octulosonic-acid transferase